MFGRDTSPSGRVVRRYMYSADGGGPEARLRSAFRISFEDALQSVAASLWQVVTTPVTPSDQLRELGGSHPTWRSGLSQTGPLGAPAPSGSAASLLIRRVVLVVVRSVSLALDAHCVIPITR